MMECILKLNLTENFLIISVTYWIILCTTLYSYVCILYTQLQFAYIVILSLASEGVVCF